MKADSGQETVFVVSAVIDGQNHQVLTELRNDCGRDNTQRSKRSIVLMTDRGIYRPSQQLHFKGILIEQAADLEGDRHSKSGGSVSSRCEWETVSKLTLKTNGFGSFHGTFPIPTGSLLADGRCVHREAVQQV